MGKQASDLATTRAEGAPLEVARGQRPLHSEQQNAAVCRPVRGLHYRFQADSECWQVHHDLLRGAKEWPHY